MEGIIERYYGRGDEGMLTFKESLHPTRLEKERSKNQEMPANKA